MTEQPSVTGKSLLIFGVIIGFSLILSFFLLGKQLKNAMHNQQTISVKGLAQKPVTADNGQWKLGVKLQGATEDAVLDELSKEMQAIQGFLKQSGFSQNNWETGVESLAPHMVEQQLSNGNTQSVQDGYEGEQSITLKTKDLSRLAQAYRQCTNFNRKQAYKTYCDAPEYLVSNLEGVKMSLIADATKNARSRAEQFVKNDGGHVGPMISAKQGAFYIIPVDGEPDDNDYGGTYDKSTIDKMARVVVTVDYAIQ